MQLPLPNSILRRGSIPVALATVAMALAACSSAPSSSGGTTTTGIGNTGTTTTTAAPGGSDTTLSPGEAATQAVFHAPYFDLTGATLELIYTHSTFVSCPEADRAGIPSTFSGGSEVVATPDSAKIVRLLVVPLATSSGGDQMNGTIKSNGDMDVSGKGAFDSEHLTLVVPAKASGNDFKAAVPVAGTATVSLYEKVGDCVQNWKVSGQLSPPPHH